MNDVVLAHVSLAEALRKLIETARETRLRVLEAQGARDTSGAADEEALHDFRVSLRRMRTFLRAARILWSSKQLERIETELRFYARETGTLRDDEVLRETLDKLTLPQAARDEIGAWLVRRSRAGRTRHNTVVRILREGPTRKDVEHAGEKRIRHFELVLGKLDDLLGIEPVNQLSTIEFAWRATQRAIRDVVRSAQADVEDVEAMHALRIREKRLRYTAELFTGELGEDASRLTKHATRMQRRLGELHDVDDALLAVTRARGLAEATQQATAAALRVVRAECAAKIDQHLIETRELSEQLVPTSSESLTMRPT
jgi:CHAD domain-containing protein